MQTSLPPFDPSSYKPGAGLPPVDMSTFTPLEQPQTESPVSRFFSSLKDRLPHSLTGPMGQGGLQPQPQASAAEPNTFTGQWNPKSQQWEDVPPANPATATADYLGHMKDVLKKSFSDAVDMVTHPSQLMSLMPNGSPVTSEKIQQALTPKEVEQWQSGDQAGALGTGAADVYQFLAGLQAKAPLGEAESGAAPAIPSEPEFNGPAAVRGAYEGNPAAEVRDLRAEGLPETPATTPAEGGSATRLINTLKKGVNAGIRQVPVAIGASAGATAGSLAGPIGTSAGAVTGGYLGRKFADRMPQFDIPEEIAGAKASPVAEASQPVGTAPQPAATVAAPQPEAAVPNDAEDLAQALGLKNAAAAEQKYGSANWGKMVTGKQVSNAVDSVIPPSGATKGANLKAQAEADFYTQRGNVEAAVESLKKNAAGAGIEMPPSSLETKPSTASVPMFITKANEAALRDLGYAQSEIDKMKPAQAQEILSAKSTATPQTTAGERAAAVRQQQQMNPVGSDRSPEDIARAHAEAKVPNADRLAAAAEDEEALQAARADMESHGAAAYREVGRQNRALNAPQAAKMAGDVYAERFAQMPAPGGDMEANKLLGFDTRSGKVVEGPAKGVKPYVQAAREFTQQVTGKTEAVPPPGTTVPAPGEDMAPLLEKSVQAAKDAKVAKNGTDTGSAPTVQSTSAGVFNPGDIVTSRAGKVYEVAKGGPGGRWLRVKPVGAPDSEAFPIVRQGFTIKKP